MNDGGGGGGGEQPTGQQVCRRRDGQRILRDSESYLNDGLVTRNLENLTRAERAIGEPKLHDLRVLGELDVVKNHQRTVDGRHRLVVCTRGRRGRQQPKRV